MEWDDDQLFKQEIRAWADGPVVRKLYDKHRGLFSADAIRFSDREPYRFSDEQRETINIVLNGYGDKSPQWLSDLTHMEDPWRNARKGMSDRQRGNTVIPKQDLVGVLRKRGPWLDRRGSSSKLLGQVTKKAEASLLRRMIIRSFGSPRS